ncbi:MAG: sugar ABC transporter substrate-binding protein [Candidatus Gastranaerophilales bacterium]|nr:sugar ABC transporter substrate-binding protein [Candidatus Gastranaerophilales bacterium]
MNKLILNILIIALFLTACSRQEDTTIIKFSTWGSKSEINMLKPLLNEFEVQNPDIKVELVHVPNNYFQKLHLLIISNLAPDVMFVNNINGKIYMENDKFEDLTPFLTSEIKADFFPNTLKAGSDNGKLYIIPRDISNLAVYYNKDLFDAKGIPYPDSNWTIEEFGNTAKKLSDSNHFGVGFEKHPMYWLPFLWSNGGGLIAADNKTIILAEQRSKDALRFYVDLRIKYHAAPYDDEQSSATTTQLFLQQKTAMQLSGRWITPTLNQNAAFKWGAVTFPKGTNGSVVNADVSGWAMSSSSKHKKQAWRLIEFLSSKKAISEITKGGLIVPSRISIANSEVFKDDNSKIFIKAVDNAIPTPAPAKYQEMIDILSETLQPVFLGKQDVDEAINNKFITKFKNLLR